MNNDLIQKYLFDLSWRKRENANTNESFSNMQNFIASNILANDFLSSLPLKYRNAHQNSLIHIHNLESGGFQPYCCGHNLKILILNGMKTVTINARPAKHLTSITDQVMNWLFMSQQEFSGAQAFNDFDTLIAPFIKIDKLSFRDVKQQIQKLVYNLNMTMRTANQTPFTNLSLNYGVPKFLENEEAIIGGTLSGFKYSDCLDEIELIDRAISEIMTEKDPNGIPFTFPILTINLTKKFNWSSKISRLMAENAGDVGSYYWMNYIGSGINEDTIRSLCCRLNIDMSELSGPSGLWNTGEGTGSLGVVTINFPRLGFDCKGKDEKIFFEELEKRLEIAYYILNFRKERIKKHINRMMPFNILNGWSMRTYFITIGVIGLNEMCLNYLGSDITKNIDFIIKILEFMRKWSKNKQTESKQLINIEMVPGEGSSYRLAYVDKKLNPEIISLGTKRAPYYSSLLIPSYFELDVFDRLKLEEKVLPLFTGGTIFRVFLGEKKPDIDTTLDFIRKISSSKIPYFDLTSTYSICKSDHKTFRGSKDKCPECNSETEIYSRVVGYYRPVSKWNIGKVQEFKDRKYISLN